MKASMENTLTAAIKKLIEDREKEDQFSTINSKAMCIGCGRTSLVRPLSVSRPTVPKLQPYLTSNSLPGDDVMRGGFKIPVQVSSDKTNISGVGELAPISLHEGEIHEFPFLLANQQRLLLSQFLLLCRKSTL